MGGLAAIAHERVIDIGGTPILVRTDSSEFVHMLEDRYGEFVTADRSAPVIELEIELVEEPGLGDRDPESGIRNPESGLRTPDSGLRTLESGTSGLAPAIGTPGLDVDNDSDSGVSVRLEAGRWVIERGDFRAEWDQQGRRGWVRLRPSPYAIDGMLRILHSLILAREGGFLVHAASVVRNGRAFVFAGISGAGKTTIARLAPADVTLLTDEISYVRPDEQVSGVRSQAPDFNYAATATSSLTPDTWHLTPAFSAFGTPFAGELAKIGQKVRAPLAALFLLQQGPENRIEPLSGAEAARGLLSNVLFFAHDKELVLMVFNTICSFVKQIPVRRLVFTNDARVWELIA